MFETLHTILTFMRRAWRMWPILALTMMLAAGLAFFYLQTHSPEYDISMVIGPAAPPGQAKASGIDIGSAASLLGIRTGSGDAYLEQYQELLTSTALATRLDPNGPIYRGLYSSEWSTKDKRWKQPSGILPFVKGIISRAVGAPAWSPPSPARFANDMQASLGFSPVGRSNMVRVTMRTKDPEFGVKLLTVLDRTADAMLREMVRVRVTAYLGYLNHELPNVQNSENQAALAELVLEQERQLMSLNASSISFGTQLVEPPSVPYRAVGIRPLPMMALSLILGLAMGLALIYFVPAENIHKILVRMHIPFLGSLGTDLLRSVSEGN
ncbi:MAG: hypothetical protein KGJ53_15900 [Alphaproteobacteria bacterium]|nr:hypothetical protein [Alphaproteobacteria bacterium]